MNVLIFGTETEEETSIREKLQHVSIDKVGFAKGVLSLENMEQVKGYDLVWIITNSIIGKKEAEALAENGVKYLVTRSAGTDHLDKKALKKCGIHAANVPDYSPNAISEHTVMLLLTLLRKEKRSQRMTEMGDFTLRGLCGRELSSMTVGVIGCGRIGQRTIKILSGFGCRILVYSPHEKEEVRDMAEFVTKRELLLSSDAVLLHCPLTEENYHMMDQNSIAYMKNGAYLINTARGGLVDAEAVLHALKCGKLTGYGFDVYEKEDAYIRQNGYIRFYNDPVFWELYDREDVIYTPHTGFYTREAAETLNHITIDNVLSYGKYGRCANEIT